MTTVFIFIFVQRFYFKHYRHFALIFSGQQLRRVSELQVFHPLSRLRSDLLSVHRVLDAQVLSPVLVKRHFKVYLSFLLIYFFLEAQKKLWAKFDGD